MDVKSKWDERIERDEEFAEFMVSHSTRKKNAQISVNTRQKGNDLYIKEKHNESIHKSILWYFSKSIAFAPTNSEELAESYYSRSTILSHIHRFKECLVDIERASKLTKSIELKSKLEAQKNKCLSLMNCQNLNEQKSQGFNFNDKQQPPKLPQMAQSGVLPNVSEAIALMFDETFGRHFIATRDIKPGEVIIIENSYIAFPNNKQKYIICSHCLQFSWNGIPCENCTISMYCTESCKKESWKQYHNIECTISSYIPIMHIDHNNAISDVTIAIRLFIKAVNKEGLHSVLNEAEAIDRARKTNLTLLFSEVLEYDTFRSLYNLSNNVQNTDEKDKVGDALLSKIIQLLSRYTNIFNEKKNVNNEVDDDFHVKIKQILHNIRHVIDINAFQYQGSICICQDLNSECTCDSNRGAVIAPFSSFINHSCASNVSRLFLPKNRIVMFTIAPVKKGDQLYDSYGPSLRMDRSIRQKILQENFYFTCKCKVCNENWPTLKQLELVVDPVSESNIISQVLAEFKKYYPNVSEKFMFQETETVWPLNEESLKKMIKMCELIYKYCNNPIKSFLLSSYYRYFIDRIFYKLYGEDCRIPSNCFDM
ncbi:SET and MYND domain-containing protein DDB_G0273591-like [Phymastichus coffea]|uniref:SET and MYND domain-containing protein DDB_G0273591-like n=1 Tax=Phymastichus coffea TaxID=108790 RepID=UPI00273B10E3|nr:SET and MYND domain-containing protein DDB_G0273591-like [Phymastichus coffea]